MATFFLTRFLPLGDAMSVLPHLLRGGGGGFAGDALAGTFARARIRVRALAPDGQALAMAQAPVAAEVHQPFDVERDLAPKIALDLVRRLEHVADARDLIFTEVVA